MPTQKSLNELSTFLNLYQYPQFPIPSLPHSQLWAIIEAFLYIQPEGHQEPHNEFGSLSPDECLVRFEPGTFQFWLQCLNPLGHSPPTFQLGHSLHSQIFDQLLIFVNLYQHAKNKLLHLFILRIQSILESHHQTSHTHFSPCPPTEIFKHLLICMNLYQNTKNQLIPSLHSSDIVNFRAQRPNWPHSFLTIPNQKNFYQLFFFWICINMQKNEAVSSICSGEIVDLKILQSDWLRAFWPISQKQDFSQYRICAGTQQIYSKKVNDQIFL